MRKNQRGISTVLATLLMIVVAVAGSLVTYSWVMGYIGFTTGKAGSALQVQSIANGGVGGTLTVYVQNVGQQAVTLASGTVVYINGAVPAGTVTITPAGGVLATGATASIVIANGGVAAGSAALTIKVQAADGSFAQNTFYP